MSRDSGAGAYVQSSGTAGLPPGRSSSAMEGLVGTEGSHLHPPTLLGGANGRQGSVTAVSQLYGERQRLHEHVRRLCSCRCCDSRWSSSVATCSTCYHR